MEHMQRENQHNHERPAEMSVYMEKFILPTAEDEQKIIKARKYHNGGAYGYIDNEYPCGLFRDRDLRELNFKTVTILYGGNGSGKSTLLNVIAGKLELNRIAPFNSSEVFDDYADHCDYLMGYDDEGFKCRIPNGSRIITSDDIFDFMLTVRVNNSDIAENIEDARDEWYNLRFTQTIKFDPINANVKHFFTLSGKEFFPKYGKQFLTLSGKENFTLYGNQFFTSYGKEFFTSFQTAWDQAGTLSTEYLWMLEPV